MDTTYVNIMLVIFLALACLAIDVGYMYVSDEDLQSAAETAALAGAQSVKQRMLYQMQKEPARVAEALTDTLQPSARTAAMEAGSGKQDAAALVGIANGNRNAFGGDNDITVGFWNLSSHSYTPGGTPVNAVQVRTRRTAESSTVGMGALGDFLAKVSGVVSFGFTPVATAAIPAGTDSRVAVCAETCQSSCIFPEICAVGERRMTPASGGGPGAGRDRYLFTSLLHPAGAPPEQLCQETSPQEVCGRGVYVTAGNRQAALSDLKAMMYDPKVDRSNKEYDGSGRLVGWWVLAPAVDCAGNSPQGGMELRVVKKYSLVRISRICASGPSRCGSGGEADLPPSPCASGESALYIDRISCVGCESRGKLLLPGLHPVLVEQGGR